MRPGLQSESSSTAGAAQHSHGSTGGLTLRRLSDTPPSGFMRLGSVENDANNQYEPNICSKQLTITLSFNAMAKTKGKSSSLVLIFTLFILRYYLSVSA